MTKNEVDLEQYCRHFKMQNDLLDTKKMTCLKL